jgi:hypothetical protein
VWNEDALLYDKFLNRKKRNPFKIAEGYNQYYLLYVEVCRSTSFIVLTTDHKINIKLKLMLSVYI